MATGHSLVCPSNAVLYVPQGCRDAYNVAPWNEFNPIMEMECGVEQIATDTTTTVNDNIYYDLTGRRVLNPGRSIYIKWGRKVIVR